VRAIGAQQQMQQHMNIPLCMAFSDPTEQRYSRGYADVKHFFSNVVLLWWWTRRKKTAQIFVLGI